MPGTPRVTVLIPNHEDGVLLIEAIASIREQEPVCVIVCDDGSRSAENLSLLRGIDRPLTQVVMCPPPAEGPHRALGAGLERVATPYVFRLDADDMLIPGALGALADHLDAHPALSFAYGDHERFGTEEKVIRTFDWDPWLCLHEMRFSPALMLRTSTLRAIGGFPGGMMEDWALYMRLAEFGVLGEHIDTMTYRRRMHGPERREGVASVTWEAEYRRMRAANPHIARRETTLRWMSPLPRREKYIARARTAFRTHRPAWLGRALRRGDVPGTGGLGPRWY